MDKIEKTEQEWKAELTDEQYHILRNKGTERAFTGELLHNKETGVYACAACDNPLFMSDSKYDSGSGWPSFWEPISKDAVTLKLDKTFGMIRTEVECARCGSHLGHVFNDGPTPSGDRFCMNSASLGFKKED